MPISTTSVGKLLEPTLNVIVGLNYPADQDEWRQMGFSINKATKRTEEDVMFSGFGIVPDKADGAPLTYDVAQEGWSARYTQNEKALGFSVTEQCVEDELYLNIVPKMAMHLKKSFVVTKNIEGADVFNNAFDATVTGGDGVSLCNTAHPLTGPSGGTFSNMLAVGADISEAALEDMLMAIGNLIDERGKPCNLRARKLIVSNRGGDQFEAARILQSEYRTGTADNDINAIVKNKYIPEGFVDSQFLTDDDRFFILTDCKDGLKYFEKVKFQSKMEGDFETGNMRYKGRERYVFGWTDPRHVFGSNPA